MEDFENVTRFEQDMDGYMSFDENGDWVRVDDYFKLLEEYKRVLSNQGG